MAIANGVHNQDDGVIDTEANEVQELLSDLISRAKVLLLELEQFRQHLRSIRQESHVETGKSDRPKELGVTS